MPGTTMLDAFGLSLQDALSILLASELHHYVDHCEIAELRRIALSIVDAHAAEAAHLYMPRLDSAPTSAQGILKVVQGGKDDKA